MARICTSFCPITTITAPHYSLFFFFNDTATSEIYTLSLHDALPILISRSITDCCRVFWTSTTGAAPVTVIVSSSAPTRRSEEHTSELQSQSNLVCRLLLEKKNKNNDSRAAVSTTCHSDV